MPGPAPAGARVFITDVDTPAQLDAIREWPIEDIQTNRIEVIRHATLATVPARSMSRRPAPRHGLMAVP
jgi:hypothetical protein